MSQNIRCPECGETVHYHAHDVIRALIGEVRRLRDESPYDDRSI